MESETSIKRFQEVSGIRSKFVASQVINFLISKNIGVVTKTGINFSTSDKVLAALLAIQLGGDIQRISTILSWKDFEKLASEILTLFGYKTRTNVGFTKPRMEIDVVGVDSTFAIAVDCKHWKKSNLASLATFAKKQAIRAERLKAEKITVVVPVILTLYSASVTFTAGVPIVPVHQFKSFVLDVQNFLPEINLNHENTSIAR